MPLPLPLQGITRTESDELWQQHAGPVMASLDSAGLEATLAVLFLLMELPRCRRTIEGKGWWGVTAKFGGMDLLQQGARDGSQRLPQGETQSDGSGGEHG